MQQVKTHIPRIKVLKKVLAANETSPVVVIDFPQKATEFHENKKKKFSMEEYNEQCKISEQRNI